MTTDNLSPDTSAPPSPAQIPEVSNRRRWMIGGAALLGVGAGLVGWKFGAAPGAHTPAQEPAPGFWSQEWPAVDGTRTRLQVFQGRPLLVNFWATWCPPCVEELPLINAFYDQHRGNGMQVLGIAVDKASAVQTFLAQNPLSFPVLVAGMGGGDFARSLGNLSGGLPFSLMVGSDGSVVQRKMGRLAATDLAQWAGLK